MKKIFVLLLLFVFAAGVSQTEAQTRRTIKMKPYFMATIFTGINFPMGEELDSAGAVNTLNYMNGDENKAFPNIGLDLAYHFVPNFAVYGDVSYNFLSKKEESQLPNTTYSGQSILEAYVGPRFFFGMANAKVRPFVEAGVGIYNNKPAKYEFTDIQGTVSTSETSSVTHIGFNGGAGIYVNLNNSLNLFARAKYHHFLKKSDADVTFSTTGLPSVTSTYDVDGGSYIAINLGLGIKF